MLKNLLLITALILSLFSYLYLLFQYLNNKHKKIEKYTGFDIAKEITNDYDNINIVESKEVYISKYNTKRKVIRLTKNTYNSNNFFSLAIALILSGYSKLDVSKDKSIQLVSRVFNNLDFLDKSILISLLLSSITNSIGDSKILIIILIIISIYQYLLLDINEKIKEYVNDNNKILADNFKNINKIMNKIIYTRKLFFISNLILILRQAIIILKI